MVTGVVNATGRGSVTDTYAGFAAPCSALPRNIAIIGAGPAGLIAAEVLATAGHKVTVYDRMPSAARKFLMAGRGGLNLTHSESFEAFVSRYQDAGGAVHRAITAFPPSAVIDWANGLGAETFIGSSGRVFPKAMKASPLLRVWLQRLGKLGVELKTRHTWTGFTGGGLTFIDGQGATFTVKPDATILALGGASWPRLGSDGTWVAPLQNAGVGVTPLQASNCGVVVPWSAYMAKLEGAPLKRITVACGAVTRQGEAVITKTGLEGGVIYALSREIREALRHGAATITIDLRSDLPFERLRDRLADVASSKDTTTNILRKAAGLNAAASAVIREPGPLPRTPDELARRIKSVPLHVTALASLDHAISTAGGVDQSGLDASFMLRAHPGVFAAGEMLDWDAPTGGYLLQASLATGVAAARGALSWVDVNQP